MGFRSLALSATVLAVVTSSWAGGTKPTELPKDVVFVGDHPYKANQILVRRKNGVNAQQFAYAHKLLGTSVKRRFERLRGLEVVSLPAKMSVQDAIALYKRDSRVLYVEPDYYVHTQTLPNDTKFAEQWALHNTGASEGVADADVNGPEMWELTKGSQDVVVGIIDTGVLHTHPDLKANIWNNPGEIAGNNIDDDNNGYVDDVHGINAITKKGDPLDDNGHGSHVAGIIGAAGDNATGTSGVNQKISIVGCKFLDRNGGGSTSDSLACMDYMLKLKTRTTNPVNLVATNNSWAGGDYSQAMFDAIRAHKEAGILFVAAASNEGDDNDVTGTFPANYTSSNVISVAATNRNDGIASFSNFGKHSVHVAAPGVDILSTVLDNDYDSYSGTSMAAPHVTGMAGLIKAFNQNLDWKAIKNLIIAGGQPIAAVKDNTISGRRLRGASSDGTGSLTCVNQAVNARLSPRSNALSIAAGTPVEFSVINLNCAAPRGAPSVSSNVGDFALLDDGQGKDDSAGDGIYTASWTPSSSGNYTFDFGNGDVVNVNVYNTASWKNYKPSTPSEFKYRTIEGAKLEMSDDSVAEVVSPFPVRFAGDDAGFALLHVGSNGTLSFTNKDVIGWQNQSLPFADVQSFLAAFWDDLNPTRVGGVYYEVQGQAPNRELVVEWRGVPHFDTPNPLTFQIVLFENSSDVLFNYLDVSTENATYDGGASATVGVQVSPTQASLVGYNTATLKDNTAILFSLDNAPIDVTPVVPVIAPVLESLIVKRR